LTARIGEGLQLISSDMLVTSVIVAGALEVAVIGVLRGGLRFSCREVLGRVGLTGPECPAVTDVEMEGRGDTIVCDGAMATLT